MRKLLPRILFLLGGLVAGLAVGLLLPAAQRLRPLDSSQPGSGEWRKQMPGG
jgi:hypothetical protein